jgi:hypothetical protein
VKKKQLYQILEQKNYNNQVCAVMGAYIISYCVLIYRHSNNQAQTLQSHSLNVLSAIIMYTLISTLHTTDNDRRMCGLKQVESIYYLYLHSFDNVKFEKKKQHYYLTAITIILISEMNLIFERKNNNNTKSTLYCTRNNVHCMN